jgi:hypothetical protein
MGRRTYRLATLLTPTAKSRPEQLQKQAYLPYFYPRRDILGALSQTKNVNKSTVHLQLELLGEEATSTEESSRLLWMETLCLAGPIAEDTLTPTTVRPTRR